MRTAAWIALVVVTVFIAGYAFTTGGTPTRKPAEWLTAQKISHRGMWTEGPARPEDSLAAFDEAASSGFAVELDVHSSADGVTVVVHDSHLGRMTGEDVLVEDLTLEELKELRLLGGDEEIPTLEEVLALVDGRVPVFVEIKNEGDVGALEDDVAAQLAAYDGEACVMSFNPYSLAQVAASEPDIVRGQLASRFKGEDLPWYQKLLLANMMMNWTSKPDFVAYDIDALPCPGVTVQTWRGRPILGWTIDDADELAYAEKYCDGFICNPGALEE
ncbi:MAG: glycerophosphodiester phosphodiesterase family protein [Coriobacteriia bacterium]|nr:glycerophosphodiester phosphodiesterase family protein [Coriobacteriia bacterium]